MYEPKNMEEAQEHAIRFEQQANHLQGIPFCLKQLEVYPQSYELNTVVANLYGDSGNASAGIGYALKALEISPSSIRAIVAYAYLLNLKNCPCKALEVLAAAPASYENDFNFLLQRSLILRNLGKSREALADLQKVIEQNPTLASARSNYLLYLHDVPGLSAAAIFKAHENYGHYCAPSYQARQHGKIILRDKINLGFVSADFRRHSVCYFLLPLLENLDRNEFRIFLYSNNKKNDEVTEELKALADHFYDITGKNDKDAAEIIETDNIHVLFDLSGHTSGNRLGIFSLKPAPVQVNWLGYPDTSGISAMDYRLVDPVTDPVGESLTTEEQKRIAGGFLCFKPDSNMPDVSELPADQNGYITFGSFNNLAKTGPDLLNLWAEIIKGVDDSRLCLKSPAFSEESGRERVLKIFADKGIAAERIILLDRSTTQFEHLNEYSKIDIALDTFPYNGTTTTFEALYMGVAVITLKGQTHVQRVGASILERLDLKPLIASSAADYYNFASALARQRDDLRNLRQSLRARLLASQLCDGPGFARKIMVILKEMCK